MISRRPPNPKMHHSIPTQYLILGALALAIAFLYMRGRNRDNPGLSAEAPPAAVTQNHEVQLLPKDQPGVDVRKYQQDLNRERMQQAQARAYGLQSMPLKAQGEILTIPIVLSPHKVWCQGGDLDTMKYATKDENAKSFVITLEEMGKGGKAPFVRASLRELYKGMNFTLTLPRPKETSAFGLYICSDTRQENSCQRKGMESHAKISDTLAENPNALKGQDRVYYFQNLVLDGKRLETYRTKDFGNEYQRSISTHLTKRGLSASEIEAAWKTTSVLKSAPATIQDGKVIVSLPYNDPRCLQGQAK